MKATIDFSFLQDLFLAFLIQVLRKKFARGTRGIIVVFSPSLRNGKKEMKTKTRNKFLLLC